MSEKHENSKRGRVEVWIQIGIALVAFAFGVLLFVHRLWTSGDNLDHVLYARNFLLGQWHAMFGWRYPPGYALVVSVLLRALGVDLADGYFRIDSNVFYWIKCVNLVAFPMAAVVVYRFSRRLSGSCVLAAWTGFLFATNQQVAVFGSFIGTEMLFMVFSIGALALWERQSDETNPGFGVLFAACCVTVLALSIRGIGISIPAGVVLWLLLIGSGETRARRWLAAVVPIVVYGTLSIVGKGNLKLVSHVVSSQPAGYGEEVQFIPKVLSNFSGYTLGLTDMLIPKMFGTRGALALAGISWLAWPVRLVVFSLLVVGFIALLRRRGVRVSMCYLACYAGILMVWPYHDYRFLLPLLPVCLLFFLKGTHIVFTVAGRRRAMAFSTACALLVLWNVSVNVYAGVKNWRNIIVLWERPVWAPERYEASREEGFAAFMKAAEWISSNTPSNATVYCSKALFMELASRRKVEYYPYSDNPEAGWAYMTHGKAVGPRYILQDTFDAESEYGKRRMLFLDPVVDRRQDSLIEVYRCSAGTRILQLKEDAVGAIESSTD